MDAFHYFGTDVHYLETHLLKHLKPGGRIGIVSPASPVELPAELPAYMAARYYWMNSVDWWGRHWRRTPELTVELCEAAPHGWEQWLRFYELDSALKNSEPHIEYHDLIEDQGRYMGFVRMVGRRG